MKDTLTNRIGAACTEIANIKVSSLMMNPKPAQDAALKLGAALLEMAHQLEMLQVVVAIDHLDDLKAVTNQEVGQ